MAPKLPPVGTRPTPESGSVKLEHWRAATLAKASALMAAQPPPAGRRRVTTGQRWRRLRLRLGCWVAGRDLDDW